MTGIGSGAMERSMDSTKVELYFARLDAAVKPLLRGKKVSTSTEDLQLWGRTPNEWRIDLHNAVAVDQYDPSDCLEGSCPPHYAVSVLVKGGRVIASAKRKSGHDL